ncbi:hypothetical protein MO973_04715 [Paenibacillus sp. TRM 82003]|nr:hypothetical protein [Paenibacillus sp. TRM 82003]
MLGFRRKDGLLALFAGIAFPLIVAAANIIGFPFAITTHWQGLSHYKEQEIAMETWEKSSSSTAIVTYTLPSPAEVALDLLALVALGGSAYLYGLHLVARRREIT